MISKRVSIVSRLKMTYKPNKNVYKLKTVDCKACLLHRINFGVSHVGMQLNCFMKFDEYLLQLKCCKLCFTKDLFNLKALRY